MDKMTLMERRVSRLMTRGAFVSFLMWAFVFIAATIGRRASWQKENNWWIRCTLRKSIFMLLIASLLGIWKLKIGSDLMGIFHRFHHDSDKNGFDYQK